MEQEIGGSNPLPGTIESCGSQVHPTGFIPQLQRFESSTLYSLYLEDEQMKPKYYDLKLSKEELQTTLNIINFYKSENHYFKNNIDNPELKQKVNDIEDEVRRTIIRNNLEH